MENQKPEAKKKERDPLLSLKYKGYCRAHTPPGDRTSYEDLLSFAKFFLCKHSHRLWKDPVWDQYTDEEILVEYFAHLFANNKEMKADFEVAINAGTEMYGEDIYGWLDRMVAENQAEMSKKAEELPEKISFSPETNKDIEE